MRFFKMNGLGNDYVFIERGACPDVTKKFVRELCNVHTGIGADGVVIYEKGVASDLAMRIYNSDGSEAEMCGNALRCLVYRFGEEGKTMTVLTGAGVKSGYVENGEVTTNLGKIVSIDTEFVHYCINNRLISGKRVNVGNPHFVLFDKYDEELAKSISLALNANVEFIRVEDEELFMRVYERGSGETMACGTGAAAAFATTGLARANVHLPGGILKMRYSPDGDLLQTGTAKYNFKGETDV